MQLPVKIIRDGQFGPARQRGTIFCPHPENGGYYSGRGFLQGLLEIL